MQLATEAEIRYSHQAAQPFPPVPEYSPTGIAVRLFLTCWIAFVLHFASNTVREVYLALAIGDHLSFRVDEYANMHPDLFDKPGYGWHIGANPGASMLVAIPYAMARPVIDPIIARVNAKRAGGEPPVYNSPWPMARKFYAEAWRRGLDVKFGLGALVMQAFAMAPLSALAAVFMFLLFRRLLESDRTALWIALLYAFATPVFFRTGYVSHNMMLGHIAFIGFLAMWNPGKSLWISPGLRYLAGGLAGGTAVLFDYSGALLLLGMFAYGVLKRLETHPLGDAVRHGCWYIAGSIPPVLLLWFYQWASFGNPFLPGQHWMPPVQWIDRGYQGFSPPQLELMLSLAFDYRYGLFLSAPLFLLGVLYPLARRKRRDLLPSLELWTMLAMCIGMWLFFSGVNYTRLQFNTGIRYLSAIFPFLFVPSAMMFVRLSIPARYFVALFCLIESWCLAMHRDVERGLGLLDPVLSVFFGGFQLPILTVLSNMGGQYSEHLAKGVSPLPLFAVVAVTIYGIWSRKIWRAG